MHYSQRRIRYAFIIAAAIIGTFLCRVSIAASTDHIREFAKNSPAVYIVCSGDAAEKVAADLKSKIKNHSENKHDAKDIQILTLAEAMREDIRNKSFRRSQLVFLLIPQEMSDPIPQNIAELMLYDLSEAKGNLSIVRSALQSRPGTSDKLFTVEIVAPDSERATRLLNEFENRQADNFRDLPFAETYHSNKIALFSTSELKDEASGWGEVSRDHTWDYREWHPLSDSEKLTPEQIAEFHQVYFLSRSDPDAPPDVAVNMLAGHTIKATTTIVARVDNPSGTSAIVFSAPTGTILKKKMARYANVPAVPSGTTSEDAADLRRLGSVPLRVDGSMLKGADREAIGAQLASGLRQLKLTIEERGKSLELIKTEITLQMLQGATDSARKLRRKIGSKYLWLYSLSEFEGSTTYEPYGSAQDEPPTPFTGSEPERPTKGDKEKSSDFEEREHRYETDHAAWEDKKKQYDRDYYDADVRWERKVAAEQKAHATGRLILIDLDGPNAGDVVWDLDCSRVAEKHDTVRSDTVVVHGFNQKPPSLPTPDSKSDCQESLKQEAAVTAAAAAIEALQEKALLPGDGNPTGPSDGGTRTSSPVIADINDNVVTLNVGAIAGLTPGMLVKAIIKTRTIRDPNTGAVLEVRVDDFAMLKVISSGTLADCVASTAADQAKLGKLTKGMVVTWTHPIPRPGALRGQKRTAR